MIIVRQNCFLDDIILREAFNFLSTFFVSNFVSLCSVLNDSIWRRENVLNVILLEVYSLVHKPHHKMAAAHYEMNPNSPKLQQGVE